MQHLGKKINLVSHLIKRTIDASHVPYNINGKQSRMLGYIAHETKKRDLYQKDIEEEFNIRRSSVTSMLQNLEKADLIQRVSVESDARLKKLVLTEKGKQVTETTYHNIVAFEEELNSLFNEEEITQFISYLDRMTHYLEEKEENQ